MSKTISAAATGLPNSDLDAELITLGAELEGVHRQRLEIEDGPDDNAKYEGLYTTHWALREKIGAIPAVSKAGRRVKARAVEMALHFDQDCENSGPGSFASLSQSLCRDLLVEEYPATAGQWAAIEFEPRKHLPESIDDLAAAVAKASAARAAKFPLLALENAQRKAFASFEEICDFSDYISKDDPSYPILEAEYDRRDAAEDAAMTAVCAYPARTLDEAKSKALFITKATHGSIVVEHQVKALLQSFIHSIEA